MVNKQGMLPRCFLECSEQNMKKKTSKLILSFIGTFSEVQDMVFIEIF